MADLLAGAFGLRMMDPVCRQGTTQNPATLLESYCLQHWRPV
jgi:hypothetical protein